MYLLDTDHMSVLRFGGADAMNLSMRLSRIEDAEIVSCIVVYEEQMRGWLERAARARSGRDHITAYASLTNNLRLYCEMTLLEFDLRAADIFDNLMTKHIRIGTPDLKIAAIVMANNAILLTRNTRHFSKVPGLQFEDWTARP